MTLQTFTIGTFSQAGVPETGEFESIATSVVGSGGTSSVTFSSIPSTYTHLQIRAIVRTNAAPGTDTNTYCTMRVGNGSVDSGANYAHHDFYGDGSTTGTVAVTSQTTMYLQRVATANAGTGVFAPLIMDFWDYKNTNKYKTMRMLGATEANGTGRIYFSSNLWMSTSAINIITIYPDPGTLISQYSHFALYGIEVV